MGKRFLKDVVKERKSSLKLSQVNDNGYFPVFGASGIVGYRDDFQIGDPAVAIIKDGAGIGRVSLLPKKSSVLGTMEAFVPNSDISNEYLYFYLTHLKLGQSFTGSTIPHIYFKNYKNSVFPDESFDNQVKKASYLISISNEISKKKNQIDNLDFLVKSLFNEMFGHYFEDSRYFVKVGDIATATIGLTYKPDNVTDEGIIVLRSGNIQNAELCLSDDIVRVSNIKIKENKFVRENDILMCSRNGSARLVGKCCLIPKLNEQMSYGAFMTVIRSKYPYFLNGFFNSTYFLQQLTGTQTASVNQITTGMLNGYTVIKPSDTEENEFATFVKLIDKSKFVCHSRYFLWLCLTLESSTMAYSSVVSIFECPKRRWTCSIGIPLSIAFVANVRRNL